MMQEITEVLALQLAQKKVNQLAYAVGDRFKILPEKTQTVEHGWIFFFNTSDFVLTGNPASRLAGNGPIFVTRNGEIHELPSSVPWEESLKLLYLGNSSATPD